MFNKDDDDDDDDSSLKWRLGIFYSDVFGLTPFTHTHTHTPSLSLPVTLTSAILKHAKVKNTVYFLEDRRCLHS